MSLLAVVPILLFASAPPPPLAQQGYMGAQAALAEMNKRAPKGVSLTDRVNELAKQVSTMPPAESAEVWHKLFMESLSDRSSMMSYDGSNVAFKALPPPAAWPLISQKLDSLQPDVNKRTLKEHALALMGHLLIDNREAQWKDLASLQIGVKKLDPEGEGASIAQAVFSLYDGLAVMNSDKERILKGIERRLSAPASEYDRYSGLEIPDLVTLYGPEKASALLKRILTTYTGSTIYSGAATRKLAKQIALQNIATLKAAPWNLVEEVGEIKLYEALIKKFPAKGAEEEMEMQEVKAYYIASLIIAGRAQEASKELAAAKNPTLARYLTYSMSELHTTAASENLWEFFHVSLTKDPKLPFWTPYIALSATFGKNQEMLTLLAETNRKPNLGKLAPEIKGYYASALLAVGRIDEGIAELKASLAAPSSSEDYSKMRAVQTLGELGILLNKPELTNLAIETGLAMIKKGETAPTNLASLLFRTGRGPEAEKYLIETIQQGKAQSNQYSEYSGNSYRESNALYELLGLYYAANRPEDIVYFVENYTEWPSNDIKALLNQTASDFTKPSISNSTGIPIAFMVASALASTGRQDRALPILEAIMVSTPGFDKAYELYTQLKGVESIATFDRLYALDQFEERPLIWKATVLLKANRIDEAEAVAKSAIAIDPSDGEQGKGDRMRVYAVSADILEKKGNMELAATFRNAVKAIRAAEEADDYLYAGLVTKSIEMYEKSLELFADAYCIQSRLAIQLASQGRFEEAQEHYRRAYELMPDSFGRIESHCFGCEAAFSGEEAQILAEEVFVGMLKKQPSKPQLHYLMGYLRETQDRKSEALVHFKEAVKLDPDYINAWSHILALSNTVPMSKEEVEEASSALLRLDPLGRHRTGYAGGEHYSL